MSTARVDLRPVYWLPESRRPLVARRLHIPYAVFELVPVPMIAQTFADIVIHKSQVSLLVGTAKNWLLSARSWDERSNEQDIDACRIAARLDEVREPQRYELGVNWYPACSRYVFEAALDPRCD
jgi:hypothetical protein